VRTRLRYTPPGSGFCYLRCACRRAAAHACLHCTACCLVPAATAAATPPATDLHHRRTFCHHLPLYSGSTFPYHLHRLLGWVPPACCLRPNTATSCLPATACLLLRCCSSLLPFCHCTAPLVLLFCLPFLPAWSAPPVSWVLSLLSCLVPVWDLCLPCWDALTALLPCLAGPLHCLFYPHAPPYLGLLLLNTFSLRLPLLPAGTCLPAMPPGFCCLPPATTYRAVLDFVTLPGIPAWTTPGFYLPAFCCHSVFTFCHLDLSPATPATARAWRFLLSCISATTAAPGRHCLLSAWSAAVPLTVEDTRACVPDTTGFRRACQPLHRRLGSCSTLHLHARSHLPATLNLCHSADPGFSLPFRHWMYHLPACRSPATCLAFLVFWVLPAFVAMHCYLHNHHRLLRTCHAWPFWEDFFAPAMFCTACSLSAAFLGSCTATTSQVACRREFYRWAALPGISYTGLLDFPATSHTTPAPHLTWVSWDPALLAPPPLFSHISGICWTLCLPAPHLPHLCCRVVTAPPHHAAPATAASCCLLPALHRHLSCHCYSLGHLPGTATCTLLSSSHCTACLGLCCRSLPSSLGLTACSLPLTSLHSGMPLCHTGTTLLAHLPLFFCTGLLH